jgi:hypothetical protein
MPLPKDESAMKRSMFVLTTLTMATITLSPRWCFAAPPSNADLAKLEVADQADRTPGTNKIDWNVVGKRDATRRSEALQLLVAGEIRTAEDFFNAALIFQHGDSVQDTQLALALATTATRMNPSNQDAEALMAQAWDRIMVRNGKPQWYGTQFVRSKATGKWELYPTDPNVVTDAQRQAMGLPTLAEEKAHLAAINK